jgi:hypothetical protein
MPFPFDYDSKPARAVFDQAIASGDSTIFARKAWGAYDAAHMAGKARVLMWMPESGGAIFAQLLIRALTEGCRLLIADTDRLTKIKAPDGTLAINMLLAAVEHHRIMSNGKSITGRLGFAIDAIWQGPEEVDPAILRRFKVRVAL